MPLDPTHTAVGTWSGGRFMRFGEPLDDDRFLALIRPDADVRTVLTADTYGAGEADTLLGRALEGVPREDYCLVGAVGHDFYTGEREGAKGYPRFTDARLRGPDGYGSYLRMAAERSLERIGVDAFDVLLLHNPDRTGYTSPAVWDGMGALRSAGLTRLIGVAPGPANGFTLDVIECFERFGSSIDWAMLILNPMEPWPGELALPAAEAHDIEVITRVVDYGGLFWDDVLPGHSFAEHDHRMFRPDGWIERGRERLDRMRPIADRYGLTPLQLASQWNLAHPAVRSVVPTLIQEPGAAAPGPGVTRAETAGPLRPGVTEPGASGTGPHRGDGRGPGARPIEDKRAELAATPADVVLTEEDVAELRAIGDNSGSMALKGATPDHEGEPRPDRWSMDDELMRVAERWSIDPDRDLRKVAEPVR